MIRSPKDAAGNDVYTLNDLKVAARLDPARGSSAASRGSSIPSASAARSSATRFSPIPSGFANTTSRSASSRTRSRASNANAGGDYLFQPQSVQVVRGLGLIGDGVDPVQHGHADDRRRSRPATICGRRSSGGCKEIREIVLATTNNVPIRVGRRGRWRARRTRRSIRRCVASSSALRRGRARRPSAFRGSMQTARRCSTRRDERVWDNTDDAVQAIVLLRKGEQSLPAVRDVKVKFAELNDTPGRLLPGVKLETFYDRTDLINRTTETVRENVIVGVILVTLILYVFLERRAQQPDRGDQHSAGAVVCLRDALFPRRVGQFAVAGGGRFRHHRRFVGDHGRKHFPPPDQPASSPTCRCPAAS